MALADERDEDQETPIAPAKIKEPQSSAYRAKLDADEEQNDHALY